MAPRISIEDIARLAGVSKTTVSAVLNGRSKEYRIKPETRQRVREIASRFNYTPNRMAQRLRLKKTQTIGVVIPDMANWFFSQLSESLCRTLRQAGYHLVVSSSMYNEQEEMILINNMLAEQMDGIIVASMMKTEQIPLNFIHQQTPFVYIDRRLESDHISWVTSDNFNGAYQLASHMFSQGVHELYFLGGNQAISTFRDRLQGYREALAANQIQYDPDFVHEIPGSTASEAYGLMQKLLEQHARLPEAIFAASCDFMAGLLWFLKDTFGQIPPDLRLCCYDNHSLLDFLSVKIPTIQQDTDTMAAAALDLLQQGMKGEPDIKHKIIPTQLITRS